MYAVTQLQRVHIKQRNGRLAVAVNDATNESTYRRVSRNTNGSYGQDLLEVRWDIMVGVKQLGIRSRLQRRM